MLQVIVKSLFMHKNKYLLTIIQFTIGFLSLLICLCLVDSILQYKERVRTLSPTEVLHLVTQNDETVIDEANIESSSEMMVNDKQKIIQEIQKQKLKIKISMFDKIHLYKNKEESALIPFNTLMVNNNLVELAEVELKNGDMDKFLNYKKVSKDLEYIPVLMSASLEKEYPLDKEFTGYYYSGDVLKRGEFKVVGLISKPYYFWMGNATDITANIEHNFEFCLFPQFQEFSELAYEYNILVNPNDNKNLDDIAQVKEMFKKYGEEIDLISLENEIEEYYTRQKPVVIATFLFAVIILVLSILGCIGTILSHLSTRSKEFGIYYAMGFSQRNIAVMVLGEGTVVLILSLINALILCKICMYTILQDTQLSFSLFSVGIVFVIMIITICVSEWIPLKEIKKLTPIELINERAGD